MSVDVVDGGDDAVLEFLLGGDADVPEHRASELGEEALDEVEPGAVLGSEDETEAALSLVGEPASGFLGDMRGVIVEDQRDRGARWIGRVEAFEKRDELARAMAILDAGVNLAGQQIDAGEQADRPVADIFVITPEAGMATGRRRQVRAPSSRSPACPASRRRR